MLSPTPGWSPGGSRAAGGSWSPSYLARAGAPTTVAELERHHGIFYTNRGVADWRFPGPIDALVVRSRSALRVNNGDVMRDAAIAGLGLALLPMFVVADACASGALRVVQVDVEPETEFIYIAHPEGRRASAKLRALADHLRSTFGDPPYWESGQAPGRPPPPDPARNLTSLARLP